MLESFADLPMVPQRRAGRGEREIVVDRDGMHEHWPKLQDSGQTIAMPATCHLATCNLGLPLELCLHLRVAACTCIP